MTKIDIFSGFLGAGKTTLIKKLIKEAYNGEKLVLIENKFGEIGIDGGFMQEAGVEITEMNSGCICCSLVGDFSKALGEVLEKFAPDRILIEPSGVGKLSDVIRAASEANRNGAVLNSFTTVADVNKCKMYMKNFGEFFNDQIEHASTIVLSHTQSASEDKIKACVELIREHNKKAVIVTTPWDSLSGEQLKEAMEHRNTLEAELKNLEEENICPECGHHHEHNHDECCHHDHEHHHDECCHHDHGHHHNECCHHDHGHHHDECCHHDHGHHHDECCHHDHGHHHDECCHHDHEHHHHADDVFSSWGVETAKRFTKDKILNALNALSDSDKYGIILRAKGIVEGENGEFIHFDYVPGEPDIRTGAASITGRLCVIGSKINEEALKVLFNI